MGQRPHGNMCSHTPLTYYAATIALPLRAHAAASRPFLLLLPTTSRRPHDFLGAAAAEHARCRPLAKSAARRRRALHGHRSPRLPKLEWTPPRTAETGRGFCFPCIPPAGCARRCCTLLPDQGHCRCSRAVDDDDNDDGGRVLLVVVSGGRLSPSAACVLSPSALARFHRYYLGADSAVGRKPLAGRAPWF